MTRILVVEDSRLLAAMLTALWTHEGHEVASITSDFVALLDPHHPAWPNTDLLVTDLDLGHGQPTGVDLLTVASLYHPSIRRAVLSGQDENGLLFLHARSLAQIVLPKPSQYEALVAAVR